MTRIEQRRSVRWCLSKLLDGASSSWIFHPSQALTKSQYIHYLNMHYRLQLLETMPGPLSFLLNKLPNRAL
ncbi:hypothetical protein G6F57_002618 [Rhizopus arrhizus]|uniref:Uncharacterized protein n=1 Tax=Rhizopus oryzae TaxID=64495 RepID=A0A9P6XG15_RHIOR|nr:hypothetical protein G6F23_003275 [Rhizopus arrhizus]KAG1424133.1 hypothetical protein G6F58_002521 [Rhizopus delemar]KAG0769995.1 hypothetical protein G6F24_000604 [Rhizopus arrhizus]KAG0794762.1 hypothetical protein G6F21_002625 [Rhizopus arrhizus]KAG0800085.1 hypothetical protein G6F22_002584 [Rhizopus arrhizus]